MLVSLGASNQIAGWTISTTSFSKNNVALISTTNYEGLYVKKTSFSDTQAGGFLGLDNGTAKFNVGHAAKFIKFDGSNLTVNAGNFSLDSSGNMTATRADLSGDVTATNITTVSGSIASWLLSSGALTKGDVSLQANTTKPGLLITDGTDTILSVVSSSTGLTNVNDLTGSLGSGAACLLYTSPSPRDS